MSEKFIAAWTNNLEPSLDNPREFDGRVVMDFASPEFTVSIHAEINWDPLNKHYLLMPVKQVASHIFVPQELVFSLEEYDFITTEIGNQLGIYEIRGIKVKNELMTQTNQLRVLQ